MPTFKSFENFGEYAKKKEELLAQTKREQAFKETLAGKFSELPGGNFVSALPGVESISVTRPVHERANHITADIFYRKPETDKLAHATFTLGEQGRLSGVIPKELGNITREQIIDEIVDMYRRINLNFWEYLPEEKDIVLSGHEDRGIDGKERAPARVDLRRLEFLENQPDVLFGFLQKNVGFNGYRGFVFPKFFVLEHPVAENAAFFIDFEKKDYLDIGERKKLPPEQRLPKDERKKILETYWLPIRPKTKSTVESEGRASRVVHKPTDAWIDQ
ncbi:hypothetical protein KGQ34_00005, partial [Patescibacteria group bacterium]|nr:hypothetical protein [Patescibacteria group bacterium]